MKPNDIPLAPRRRPVQARSTVTVEAIFEASIQVLRSDGLEKFNTTRVAARAGVSVGSLYQYYPNKQSLLAAVLENHLLRVTGKVEAACAQIRGAPAPDVGEAIAIAYFNAKIDRADVSSALYAVAAMVDSRALLDSMRGRIRSAVVAALPADIVQPVLVTETLMGALNGPLQGWLEGELSADRLDAMRQQLVRLARAYLS
ncbi:TetR/AcrR family transcriptional regulator [Amantichitinum ursilacus]|uniref:Transcriptional regulator BetI n=1 Tax=Amantichitinum ursilacus TaxID=857265 RepID=A0A0N0GL50_9NEIS|nr:TetR/AcrR family transcriptional regulator [Amantichitinum ursilacus]KPC49577.1 transcriptional regulator BetI [Amantichitinum ursilacus]